MERIYLLEDDDSIRKLVIYALTSQGYEAQGFDRPSEFWKAMEGPRPALVLLDEPTGALDSRSADQLLDLFAQLNREGQTILMVTHSARAASRAGRVLFIKDGEVYHQLYRGDRSNEAMFSQIADTLTALAGGGEGRG